MGLEFVDRDRKSSIFSTVNNFILLYNLVNMICHEFANDEKNIPGISGMNVHDFS